MKVCPPGKTSDDKFYVGYYDNGRLIAVLDLILAYPDVKTAFIGFFMTDVSVQNKGIGSRIIRELCDFLAQAGFFRARLGWAAGNQQAEHFWHKNGFSETGEICPGDSYTIIVAQRDLSPQPRGGTNGSR